MVSGGHKILRSPSLISLMVSGGHKVLGSPSLISLMVSGGRRATLNQCRFHRHHAQCSAVGISLKPKLRGTMPTDPDLKKNFFISGQTGKLAYLPRPPQPRVLYRLSTGTGKGRGNENDGALYKQLFTRQTLKSAGYQRYSCRY